MKFIVGIYAFFSALVKFIERFFAKILSFTMRVFFWIFLLSIIFYGVKFYKAGHEKSAERHQNIVLTLNLKGNLSEGYTEKSLMHIFHPQEIVLHDLIEKLEQAAVDPLVKGLFVRLDNTALGIAKIQELHTALKKFRASGKFAVAHTDTFGEVFNGTKEYYTASGFDEICLQPMGSLNFVGLSMEMPFARKLLDELGIEPRMDRREEYKSFLETYTHRDMSKENREALQNLLGDILSQMIEKISAEREIDPHEVRQLMDNGPYVDPYQAHQLGLIDHVFHLDECEEYVLKKAGDLAELVTISNYSPLHKAKLDPKTPAIAVIYASGPIVRNAVSEDIPFGNQESISSDEMKILFQEALADKNTKAIVFRLSSPGGSPVASETIVRLVEHAKIKGIPVIVSMGEYAASGGYWIATGATKIVAQPGTITGSIGVGGGKVVLARLWDKIGISWGLVKDGQNADMMSFNQDFSPMQWAKHQESLDYIYQAFLKRVSQNRHMSLEQAREVARGRVWTGEQAFKLGLVDALGGLDEAIQLAKKEIKIAEGQSVAIHKYPHQMNILQQLKHNFAGKSVGLLLSQILDQPYIRSIYTFFQNIFHSDTLSMPMHKING